MSRQPIKRGPARAIRLMTALMLAFSIVAVAPAPPAEALTSETFESCLLAKINSSRSAAGAAQLGMSLKLNEKARSWSEWMRYNEFKHMPQSLRDDILPPGTTAWAENLAVHPDADLPDCSVIHNMLMDSPYHRANILGSAYRYSALGAYHDETGWWVTEVFFDAVPCNGTFCDDDTSPFEADIEKVAAAEITNGCGTELFCPNAYVTRGAMAAFLARALNLPPGSSIDFVDDDNSIFETDIEAIASAGITNGCNPPANDRFCPDDFVTRGEMAAFLTRALDLPHIVTIDFIDDDNSIFEADIEAIASAGITNGCEPARFCPNEFVTRGQMAAFLARALGL